MSHDFSKWYNARQHRWDIFRNKCEECGVTKEEVTTAPFQQRDDFLDCDWCKQWKEYRKQLQIKQQQFEESLAWL